MDAGLRSPLVLDQLELIRLRNCSPAFLGEMEVLDSAPHQLHVTWRHPQATATLKADLSRYHYEIRHGDAQGEKTLMRYEP